MRMRASSRDEILILCVALPHSLAILSASWPCTSFAQQSFAYRNPGDLPPGSGMGRVDSMVYLPGIRFPIETAPAFANSQVYGHGGSGGPGGGQCDAANYSFPWRDNFCETRSASTQLCPSGQGHQGQDIRPSTCAKDVHWAVAAQNGTISHIGSYSVNLTTANGVTHRYLHMQPSSLTVGVGSSVVSGQRLGRVSNAFGGTSTTYHLHYDVQMNVSGIGLAFVPPYMSLVRAYQALIQVPPQTCAPVPAGGMTLDNRSECLALHGPSASWRYVASDGHDGDLYWSYTWENAASNWAEWAVEFAQAGIYDVEIFVAPAYADAEELRCSVLSAMGEVELRIDQSSGSGWMRLGTYHFAAGVPQRVALYDGPGEPLSLQRRFAVDAVRFTPVGAERADAGAALEAGTGVGDGAPGREDAAATVEDASESDRGGGDDGETGIRTAPGTDAGPDLGPDLGSSSQSILPPGGMQGGCGCDVVQRESAFDAAPAGILLALLLARSAAAASKRRR